jgi:hypothetical protein
VGEQLSTSAIGAGLFRVPEEAGGSIPDRVYSGEMPGLPEGGKAENIRVRDELTRRRLLGIRLT